MTSTITSDTASDTQPEATHDEDDSAATLRMEIMHAAATIYSGAGAECDPQRVLALMIMMEHWVFTGGDAAARAMGWSVAEGCEVIDLAQARSIKPVPPDRSA